MRSRKRILPLVVGLLLGLAPAAAGQVASTEYEGASALGLALRQLGTTKRVLMIGAHPDDESTQVLSTLALGDGAQVAYLSLTRGEGGQNGIGAELQEGLGLLRTGELLAARRLDGARQYFTRAIDYGFSKNADEAFRNWPREELLRDVVAVVRHFRPDVIISVFEGGPRDGHGQHQAAGIMAVEAFGAAADPQRFPDQAAVGLPPHRVTHLYRLVRGADGAPSAELVTGNFDPLFGQSHYQIAMASRSRHRSQDMGQEQSAGPRSSGLILVESRAPARTGTGVFEGVDTTVYAVARAYLGAAQEGDAQRVLDLAGRYQAQIDDSRRVFNPLQPDQVVPFLTEAAGMLDRAIALASAGGGSGLVFHLEEERERLNNALLRAARIDVDVLADDETVVPGQTFDLELSVWNGGREPIELRSALPALPSGWEATRRGEAVAQIAPQSLATLTYAVTVPADAEPTTPYFLEAPRQGPMYVWPDEVAGVGLPFETDEIRGDFAILVRNVPAEVQHAAIYRGVDSRSGEFQRPVRVVPAVALEADPALRILPAVGSAREFAVSVTATAEQPDGIGGVVRIETPPGWTVTPAAVAVDFQTAGEQRVVDFVVSVPADGGAGETRVQPVFIAEDGERYEVGFDLIDYPHVDPHALYSPATVTVRSVDVQIPVGLQVGYVAAVGDNVPAALSQLGIAVELLEEADLAAGDLDTFDVLVIGSRAYEGRADLVTHNRRLLDYVSRGGVMVVQYNQYQYTEPGIAPYPVTMARPHDRVTDENAVVRLLNPDHRIFNVPNRIGETDFEGWVQERGLYFLNTWDERFVPLMEMADEGEEPKRGALLVASHGEGTYVYTGLALFRQLAAGVPGAYRLFANLLALGVEQ